MFAEQVGRQDAVEVGVVDESPRELADSKACRA
jgi:hypothetical protein